MDQGVENHEINKAKSRNSGFKYFWFQIFDGGVFTEEAQGR